VDLQLAPSTLTVVTGPNGAGKTTLLRLAAGLLQPTRGTRQCAGRALYIRNAGGLRSALTAREAVMASAALAGCKQAVLPALQLTGAERLAARRIGTLSAGERMRVALAAAVAAGPAVLCLDEPTAALDENGLADLASVVSALRDVGCSLLVATHQPATLLVLADAHLWVANGRVAAA